MRKTAAWRLGKGSCFHHLIPGTRLVRASTKPPSTGNEGPCTEATLCSCETQTDVNTSLAASSKRQRVGWLGTFSPLL